MQNEEFEKLIQSAKAVRLSEEEKTDMLASIRFAMREPVVAEKPSFSFKMIFASRYAFASFLILLVASLSAAGVSSAAENALPGDLLYPVKVQVNEKVISALAVTPEKKAKVESNFTIRRLKEAETLAAQGKLDEKKTTILREDLVTHSEKAIQVISQIQEKPAAELNKGLDTSLSRHTEILKKLSEFNEKKKEQEQQKEEQQTEQKSNKDNSEYKKTRSYKAIIELRTRAEKVKDNQEKEEKDFQSRNRFDFNRSR